MSMKIFILYAIATLLIGVGSGLFLVITAIYIYLLWLKRHGPFNRPEKHQQSQNRSFQNASINEKEPLPPPTFTYQVFTSSPAISPTTSVKQSHRHSTPGHHQNVRQLGSFTAEQLATLDRRRASSVSSAFRAAVATMSKHNSTANQKLLLDLTSDPNKINAVFPLVNGKIYSSKPLSNHSSRTPSRSSLAKDEENDVNLAVDLEKGIKIEDRKDEDDNVQYNSRRNTIASKARQAHNQRFAMPAYTRRDTLPSKHIAVHLGSSVGSTLSLASESKTENNVKGSGVSLNNQGQQISYLGVEQTGPYRAHSADMLLLKPEEDDELRRASFDHSTTAVMQMNDSTVQLTNSGRRPGTGRKLPSTELVEAQNAQQAQRQNHFDLPQIVAPHGTDAIGRPVNPRRGSYLYRSAAFEINVTPKKQTSAPVPQNQRIYEPGHIYSRSWNAEGYTDEEIPPQLRSPPQPSPVAPQSYRDSTQTTSNFLDYNQQSIPYVRYTALPIPPAHARLVSTPRANMLSLPIIQRQAKSVEDYWAAANGESPKSSTQRITTRGVPSPLEKRSMSETARQHLIRQETVQMLHPTNELSRQCQNLWQQRNHLAERPNFMGASELPPHLLEARFFAPNLSTDISDDQSTSFESNTVAVDAANESPSRSHSTKMSNTKSTRTKASADIRRQKYRSLLIQRQIAAATTATAMAPCSPSTKYAPPQSTSANRSTSSESSIAGSTTTDNNDSIRAFASSIDSSEQSASVGTSKLERPRSGTAPRGVARPNRFARLLQHPGTRSYDVEHRDYSLDMRTDALFRDFVRVDPRFNEPQRPSSSAVISQSHPIDHYGSSSNPHLPSNQSNIPASQIRRCFERQRAPTLPSHFPADQQSTFQQVNDFSHSFTHDFGNSRSQFYPSVHYSLIKLVAYLLFEMIESNVKVTPDYVWFKPPLNTAQTVELNLKNVSKKPMLFKVLATAPKFYRIKNQGGGLAPGESIVAAVMLEPIDPKRLVGHQIVIQTALTDDLNVNRDVFWDNVDELRDRMQFMRLKVVTRDPKTKAQTPDSPHEVSSSPGYCPAMALDPPNELVFRGPFIEIVTSVFVVFNKTQKFLYIRCLLTNADLFRVRPNMTVISPDENKCVAVMMRPLLDADIERYRQKKSKLRIECMESDNQDVPAAQFWSAYPQMAKGLQSKKLHIVLHDD
ncbi:hypothetical protein M3Y96_01180400 [Aphelenchoides besseyi]|nr:hypothetical protein M3Y96_01180400 [Aphelenchoides besseyi]